MISEAKVRELSRRRGEPAWLLESRLRGWAAFERLPYPAGISASLIRGIEPEEPVTRRTYDLGEAVRASPELVRKHLGSVVDASRDKFAALNAALWTGGTFVHVPKGVKLDLPIEASVSLARGGRFDRTLIVVEEDAQVEYIEGCAAPAAAEGLRASVFEVVAEKGARARCSTIQHWPDGVVNVVAKAALARAGATVEWLDGNLGSKLTVKRPRVNLAGKGARGSILCCAFADAGRMLETGGELVFNAPGCAGSVVCLCVARGSGRARARSRVVGKTKDASIRHDVLLLDGASARGVSSAAGGRFAETVSRLDGERASYLASRGLDPAQAASLAVGGFLERFARELPLEYSVEFTRLLQLALQS